MSVSSLRARALLLVVLVLAAVAWSAGSASTQGQLKGNILPVVSTADVVGYTAPCG